MWREWSPPNAVLRPERVPVWLPSMLHFVRRDCLAAEKHSCGCKAQLEDYFRLIKQDFEANQQRSQVLSPACSPRDEHE